MPNLETGRLIIRQWKDSDLPQFIEMNADKRVMQYYPSPLTSDQSNDLFKIMRSLIDENGWGFWALESKSDAQLLGFTGLNRPGYDLPFNPCVEIGWRLKHEHWGNGYVTEAANQCLRYAFNTINLEEVVSFATVANTRSVAVMRRLGMHNMQQNFNHPVIPQGHDLQQHVLYKISATQWKRSNNK